MNDTPASHWQCVTAGERVARLAARELGLPASRLVRLVELIRADAALCTGRLSTTQAACVIAAKTLTAARACEGRGADTTLLALLADAKTAKDAGRDDLADLDERTEAMRETLAVTLGDPELAEDATYCVDGLADLYLPDVGVVPTGPLEFTVERATLLPALLTAAAEARIVPVAQRDHGKLVGRPLYAGDGADRVEVGSEPLPYVLYALGLHHDDLVLAIDARRAPADTTFWTLLGGFRQAGLVTIQVERRGRGKTLTYVVK